MKFWLRRLSLFAFVMAALGSAWIIIPPPLHVALIWNMHQPFGRMDPRRRDFEMPWVRLHTLRDYYPMARMIERFPHMRVTFNITPSLMEQLLAYAQGARDRAFALTRKPAGRLTREERLEMLVEFMVFNLPHHQPLPGIPRLRELIAKKYPLQPTDAKRPWKEIAHEMGQIPAQTVLHRYTAQDFRDLQMWFNLTWFNESLKQEEPLQSLVAKGRNYSESDKARMLAYQEHILQGILPLYKRLQDQGRIEIATSPFAHPILPLLANVRSAREITPGISLPLAPFAHPEDVQGQLQRASEVYVRCFGRQPRGLWPSEMAVSQAILAPVGRAGYHWLVADEPLLWKSGKAVTEDVPRQPYRVGSPRGSLTAFFRIHQLSQKIGFTFAFEPAADAVASIVQELRAIQWRTPLRQRYPIVTIAFDGDNPWGEFPKDGQEFLETLYTRLSRGLWFRPVTPGEYLRHHPPTAQLTRLATGSWQTGGTLDLWVGDPIKNRAWDLLAETRSAVTTAGPRMRAGDRSKAMELLYRAEGSDWFWWFGGSGFAGLAHGEVYDRTFRELLKQVYRFLKQPPPVELDIPLIQKEVLAPSRNGQGPMLGSTGRWPAPGDWQRSEQYLNIHLTSSRGNAPTNSMPAPSKGRAITILSKRELNILSTIAVRRMDRTYDRRDRLYFRLELSPAVTDRPLHLSIPFFNAEQHHMNRLTASGAREVDFGVTSSLEIDLVPGRPPIGTFYLARGQGRWHRGEIIRELRWHPPFLDFQIPFRFLGALRGGDRILYRLIATGSWGREVFSGDRSQALILPLPRHRYRWILQAADPSGDDHGPGTYRYPPKVYPAGSLDLLSFEMGENSTEVALVLTFRRLSNPWGSRVGLSHQTIDIYIDQDHRPGSGHRQLLPGRRAAVRAEDAWDIAIWVEGWVQRLLRVQGEDLQPIDHALRVFTIPPERSVVILAPKAVLGQDPARWHFGVAVLGQEGVHGVGRVRRVVTEATTRDPRQADRLYFSGAERDDGAHTNIIDMLVTPGQNQEQIAGNYDRQVRQSDPAKEIPLDKLVQIDMVEPGSPPVQ